jgi:hypothetical protein
VKTLRQTLQQAKNDAVAIGHFNISDLVGLKLSSVSGYAEGYARDEDGNVPASRALVLKLYRFAYPEIPLQKELTLNLCKFQRCGANLLLPPDSWNSRTFEVEPNLSGKRR